MTAFERISEFSAWRLMRSKILDGHGRYSWVAIRFTWKFSTRHTNSLDEELLRKSIVYIIGSIRSSDTAQG